MQFQKRFTTLLKTQACYIKMGAGTKKGRIPWKYLEYDPFS